MGNQILKDHHGEYVMPVEQIPECPKGEGWLLHKGGKRPDHVYANTFVDVVFRNGFLCTREKAVNIVWWHTDSKADVIYYRVLNQDPVNTCSDSVHHPAHYGGGDNVYEAIKVIEAWGLDFCLGNTVKYISRAGKKDKAREIQDLEKAAWYLNHHIQTLKDQK
jgi:hypothetical protein